MVHGRNDHATQTVAAKPEVVYLTPLSVEPVMNVVTPLVRLLFGIKIPRPSTLAHVDEDGQPPTLDRSLDLRWWRMGEDLGRPRWRYGRGRRRRRSIVLFGKQIREANVKLSTPATTSVKWKGTTRYDDSSTRSRCCCEESITVSEGKIR